MLQRKDQAIEERVLDWIERHWKTVVVLVWLGFCAWFIAQKWLDIRFFRLSDTDDNMRMMQVRGLLHGQGWYDLRNYRMNPPFGANIHWSRLVDLPLAGLILLLRPFMAGAGAEKIAVAVAPLLPYLLLLFSVALTARRLIGGGAVVLAFLALAFAGSTNGMFLPTRIDHHGWQLALLALSVSALADPKRRRGGIVLGLSSALSLAIGLEMIIYIAVAGVATVLFWVDDAEERERLSAYALTLAVSTAAAFLIFASNDNWHALCDALSPVWLSDALLASALMVGLSRLRLASWKSRFAIALGAGVVIAGFHAVAWPHCIHRLEGVSPEVDRLWLSHVREARPVYRHGWRIASMIVALPITGAIGWGLLAWVRRADRELLKRILAAAAPGIVASLLLLWQTRTGPAAQLLAAVGAAAIMWFAIPPLWNSRFAVVRVAGVSLAVLLGAGAVIPMALNLFPEPPANAESQAIGRANSACASLYGLHPIALMPKGMVFTFVDLGPRLITLTHHDAVTGPYHRNGQQIADVMNAFRGDAEQAHRLIGKYHSNYLLTCPNSSTTTIFASETPKGFYMQLQQGRVPGWLQPIPLPKDSPFRMWKVVR